MQFTQLRECVQSQERIARCRNRLEAVAHQLEHAGSATAAFCLSAFKCAAVSVLHFAQVWRFEWVNGLIDMNITAVAFTDDGGKSRSDVEHC